MDNLQKARQIINGVDDQMAALFLQRMEAARLVAQHKQQRGLPIFDPVREQQVLEAGARRMDDPRLREHYVRFLQSVMDISKDYQRQLMEGLRVAYSGTEGAFAHIAAGAVFPGARLTAYGNFTAAYQAVLAGECDCAVLPLENSSAGEVGQVTDMMFDGGLYVNGVYELPVRHDLLALPGATLSDITTVVSHPQALAQCAPFLEKHGWLRQEHPNTALAARRVAEQGDKQLAAIASRRTARLLGLQVLEENIQHSGSNTTRFGVFSRVENTALGKQLGDHFILLFTTRNQAGALARAIDIIGRHGFNMRTLRSRPRQDLLWEYYFYVELEGDLRGDAGRTMLEELAQCCDRVRVAGSFKAHAVIGEEDA